VAVVRERRPGWDRAFERLVDRHRSDLLRRCRARLGNLQDAEDVVQEVLMRAYKGLAGFAGNATFRTWLFAIADNSCASFATRRSRHIIGDHLRAMIALHEETQRHCRGAGGELASQVAAILEEVPAPAREVLRLRFYRDHSIEEIARIQGVGVSAAKMRLYRALDAFAESYLRGQERQAQPESA
jgi:RNA polymerase sigma-70 factor (ECF subfamily)